MEGEDVALWRISDEDLVALTPRRARDLVIECLLRSQRSAFVRAGREEYIATGEREMRQTVAAVVRLKMRRLGHDYDAPDSTCIAEIVEDLTEEAMLWTSPADDVDHHIRQLQRVRERLIN